MSVPVTTQKPTGKEVGDFLLKDRVVLVTGGGSGISFEFSRQAHAQGARVLIADLHLIPEAEELVASSDKSNITFVRTDVSKWSQLSNVFSAALSHFKTVPDVYMLGAGIFEPTWSGFWEDTETDRYASLDINVGHVVKMTRLATRALVSHGKKGVILPIASVGGLVGAYTSPLYVASKHAVVGLTRSLAPADRFESVKVVTVCPSMANTPMIDAAKREQFKVPPSVLLKPEDIASNIVKLATEGQYPGGSVMRLNQDGSSTVEEVKSAFHQEAEGDLPEPYRLAKNILDEERKKPWPEYQLIE